MPVIVSTVPKQRFDLYKINFPKTWQVKFIALPENDNDFIEALKEADFLFVGSVHAVSRKVIEKATKLKFIQVEGVGFDKVDVKAAEEHNLPVCNNQGVNAVSVAEFTIGLMIAALRRMAIADQEIKKGHFGQYQNLYRQTGVNEMRSRHVGLIGMGAIGQKLAKMLSVFACKISYYDTFRPKKETEVELNINYLPLNSLLKECNIISLHLPVLKETINIISEPEFKLMRPDCLLLNTSRGEVLDQKALALALENNKIYGAALDTLSPEPPPSNHPLLNLSDQAKEKILLTPHVAGTTNEAFTEMLIRAIKNIERVLNGENLQNIVNNVAKARLNN